MDMFDKVINLSSIVQNAADGYYESENEITKEFNQLRTKLNKYKRKALEAFHAQNTCEHLNTCTPYYQVQRRVLGTYHYVFQKDCLDCGKHFSFFCEEDSEYNERNPPEGYEGAEKRYYNNNI